MTKQQPTVHRVSLEEFQQRCAARPSSDLDDESLFNSSSLFSIPSFSSTPSPSALSPTPSLRLRIEQQKIQVANALIERYEKLFFSDNVDPRSTPIQRFFPAPLFDPAAHGAAPTPVFENAPASSPLAAVGAWFRELRRSMFLENQAARTKVWDHYSQEPARKIDQLYDRLASSSGAFSNAFALASDPAHDQNPSPTSVPPQTPTAAADTCLSAPTTTISATMSPSTSDQPMLPPLNFADRAYPAPDDRQLKRCIELAGKGVWDSFGVWRCLLPDSNGSFADIHSPGRTRLFDKFDDYLSWRMQRNQNLQKSLPAEVNHVDSIFDDLLADTTSIVESPVSSLFSSIFSLKDAAEPANLRKVDKPAPGAKIVSQSESVSQVFDGSTGKTSTVRKTQRVYDDQSVVEEIVRDEK
ncbi:uncharacterized protein V2V93DRAFT_373238 [Kockiozyma suomiensis]|uniref:uncharacterized protein n=1 Tax=Kockiozyma suomiensis TaxID=1337062 RepID=UPI00334343E2